MPVTTAETQASLDVRGDAIMVSHQWTRCCHAMAGCNTEGTKCDQIFPNLQQQFMAAIQSESQSVHYAVDTMRDLIHTEH